MRWPRCCAISRSSTKSRAWNASTPERTHGKLGPGAVARLRLQGKEIMSDQDPRTAQPASVQPAAGTATPSMAPLYIRMHEQDNVAIVANDGGLPEGTVFPCGLTLRERVPQGHKVALADLAAGDPVVRYNVVIGHALRDLPRGSWINERVIEMPPAPALDALPIGTRVAEPLPPLEGY